MTGIGQLSYVVEPLFDVGNDLGQAKLQSVA